MTSVEAWRRELGYLPVPLFGQDGERTYVLLNGGKGNFCLDAEDDRDVDPMSAASNAWSSDVDHYIAIRGDKLQLLRWDQPSWSESHKVQDIVSRLPLFQRYIESKQAPRERSVVTRALSVFRAVRGRGKQGGEREALLAFIGILSKGWLAQQPNVAICRHWENVDESYGAATELLGAAGIEMVLEQLMRPEQANKRPPSLQLMIRHAAGRIFQEAHYLALAPIQQDLFFDGQAKLIGPASRTLGAFFTPTPLVRTLVEQVLLGSDIKSKDTIHLFDPACGSGEFLREAVRQLGLSGFKGSIKVTGYDISEAACLMARFGLAAEACTSAALLDIQIHHRDALNGDPWATSVDFCLMNPPFVAWPDMTTEQRVAVSDTLAELHQKRPDMATAFLRRAVDALADGGAIGAVLPASFLDGESSAPLREFLSSSFTLELSARLGNQAVFTDVTVDPALIVARRREAGRQHAPTLLVWADHNPGSSDLALRALRRHEKPTQDGCLENAQQFSIYAVDYRTQMENWAPRPYRSARLLAALASRPKVGALFSVQQGTITGLNAAFMMSSDELEHLPKAEQRFFRPAVTNNSIKDGHLIATTWVFYPHGSDLPELASETEVASKLRHFYELRLLPYKEALLRRARIGKGNWWRLSEYRSWQVERQPKIVSTYFGTAGSFALDQTGDYVVVQGYGWLPKKSALLGDERQLLALVATLNAPITDTLLAGVSNNLAGGQWNLSKRFVERMPLVDVTQLPDELLQALAAFGESITRGDAYDSDRLHDLAYQALGINQAFDD
ncbi:MAG: N-6 DNA methylase [Sulfuritalea sp.]|nr:N-6 DNA methylase [Sulfuritalea sp.]